MLKKTKKRKSSDILVFSEPHFPFETPLFCHGFD